MDKPIRYTIALVCFYLCWSLITFFDTRNSESGEAAGQRHSFDFFSLTKIDQIRSSRKQLGEWIDKEDELIWLSDRNKQNHKIKSALQTQLNASPLSAQLWNELLYRRLKLGLLDEETSVVFGNAARLDSWYSKQRNRYIQFCLSYWDNWDPSTKLECKRMIENSSSPDMHLYKRLTGLSDSELEKILEDVAQTGEAN